MNISEFRDLFVAEYIYESQKRGKNRIELTDKLIASWLSEAQQNINTRLKPIKRYQDISIINGATDYPLNSNYGKYFEAFLGDAAGVIGTTKVKLVDTTDLLSTDVSGNKAAIFWDPTNSLYYLRVSPTPTANYTIRLWYYADTLWYSPSGPVADNWGTFDSDSFTGNFMIPDKFQMLIKYYLIGKCFDDYSQYEKELSILRVNSGESRIKGPEYKFNDP